MSPGETHKGREKWMRWSGTPALLADIAREARRAVAKDDPGPAEVRIKLVAAVWESELSDPDTLQERLKPADLPDLESVGITARAADRRIALVFAKPARPAKSGDESKPVVELHLAAPDLGWVLEATEIMKQAVLPGVPRGQRVPKLAFWAALVFLVGGIAIAVAAGQDDKRGLNGYERLGLGVLIAGGALFVVTLVIASLLPRFEIIPDGAQTKRMAVLRWANREGGWLLRAVLLIVVGSVVTLLIQRLT